MPPSSRPGPSRQCGRPPLSADTMGFPRHVSLQSAVRTSQPGRPREGARLRGPGQEGAGTGRPMPSRERARPCPCEKRFLPKPQPQNCSHGHRGRAGAWSPPCAARGPDPTSREQLETSENTADASGTEFRDGAPVTRPRAARLPGDVPRLYSTRLVTADFHSGKHKPCVSAALCAGLGRLAFTPLHGLLSAPASAHPRFL